MSSSPPDDPVRSRLRLSGGKDRVVLVAALGILSAVSPMATDMYLASMPAMAGHFGASASAVQLTLTTYMVGSRYRLPAYSCTSPVSVKLADSPSVST